MESASSVVMANGLNQSHQDSISVDQSSHVAVDQLSHEIETASIGQALKKVIPKGYRTKLSFRTPLQRGSNNSNFIKYQNSLASESVERKRLQNLGLGSAQHSTVTDRSFSIQPQKRIINKRFDDLSRGSSQDRIAEAYQTLPVNSDTHSNNNKLSQRHGSKQQSIRQESRESNLNQNTIGGVRHKTIGEAYHEAIAAEHRRVLRSPFDSQHRNMIGRIAQQNAQPHQQNEEEIAGAAYIHDRQQSPIKVPGILIDSINSQKLRSKSTFRGNPAGYGTNKLTSLQTMAHTSDQ